jgi:hypothetical protein
MPRGRQEGAEESVSLALPADVRADLLRAQQDSIETPQALPRVSVMPAGAGLFEFEDTNETTPTFRGVILGNHGRNVLWDHKYGEAPEDVKLPACSSNDGKYGVPREGFAHAGLPDGQEGDGVLMVECRTCPYNQWGSGAALIPDKNPKGKAVTNQRSIYILLEEREFPVELVLPPTSIPGFDEYLTTLLNRRVPVQAVVTEFRQEVVRRGQYRVGTVRFSNQSTLDQEVFARVMEVRSQWMHQISPSSGPMTVAEPDGVESTAEVGDDDDIPF